MKILHVISSLNTGGAELMLKRLILEHHSNPRYQHVIVCIKDKGTLGDTFKQYNIRMITLNATHVSEVITISYKLFCIFRREKPEIIQTWMYHADLLGGIVGRLCGIKKIIWGIRNTDLYPNQGVSRFTWYIMKLCAFLSKYIPEKIICVSDSARIRHIKYGYTSSQMEIIHNGFNVDDFDLSNANTPNLRDELDIPEDAFIIGSIGRFNPYKDHINFIRSAQYLLKEHPTQNLFFVLVGRDISFDNLTLKNEIESSKYPSRFRLLGERSDIPNVLQMMDIFCLHSLSEGFPNVLGEAMSASIPCVTTDVGDARLLLGDTGILVTPKSPTHLAKGILTLIEKTPEERAALGRAAQQRIRNHWSLARICGCYESLYEQLLSTSFMENSH